MATDTSVRDFTSRATIKAGVVAVMVKLNVKNGEIARASFTVLDWLNTLKEWPNEHYGADEFVKKHFWSQFSEDAPEVNQRLVDSMVRAIRKAVAALSTEDQPVTAKGPMVPEWTPVETIQLNLFDWMASLEHRVDGEEVSP